MKAFVVISALLFAGSAQAGQRGGPPAQAPKAAAPIDLTGYWVSIVSEDWRYRMVTPTKGDYQGVPVTPDAVKIAEAWNPEADTAAGNQCRSYGAPAIMRVPGRFHFTWDDDQTIRIDIDAGTQTRLLRFSTPGASLPRAESRGWQGDSVAEWDMQPGGRGAAANAPRRGSLKVVTTNLKSGYLRKNGIPYSEDAKLTEYFDVIRGRNGDVLLMVTAIVDDPKYLRQPFIVSTQFKKQADAKRMGADAMFIKLVARVTIVLAMAAPALAQTELAGSWAARNHEDALERGGGPYAVDYAGLPLNDEARARALSYSGDVLSMIEHQCGGWPPFYLAPGPFGMKIWNDTDPVTGTTVAWKIGAWEDRAGTTIWMDGRPHPSKNAPHERGGFTTGEWQGTTLVAYTTHIKAGSIRRNGAPSSDQATMTMHFVRHGDLLTVLEIIEDPVYLTEPELLSKNFQLDNNSMSPVGPPCVAGYEGVGEGKVPHYLPGANPSIDELTKFYGIPREATLGGAETMYPEYRKTIKDKFVRPEKCTQNCGAPAPPPPPAAR